MTDPSGSVTEFTYDHLGRVLAETITVGGVALTHAYEYDLVGNLKFEEDRDGNVRRYDYDELNRLIEENWFTDATAPAAAYTLQYTFDVAGR